MCTPAVSKAVNGPCTRAVYIHGRVHGRLYDVYTTRPLHDGDTARIDGRVQAVHTALYGLCTRPCTRAEDIHGRVHGRLHVYTARTWPGTARVDGRIRAVHAAVYGSYLHGRVHVLHTYTAVYTVV